MNSPDLAGLRDHFCDCEGHGLPDDQHAPSCHGLVVVTAAKLVVDALAAEHDAAEYVAVVRTAQRDRLRDEIVPPLRAEVAVLRETVDRVKALADEWDAHPYALVSGNPRTRLRAALGGAS